MCEGRGKEGLGVAGVQGYTMSAGVAGGKWGAEVQRCRGAEAQRRTGAQVQGEGGRERRSKGARQRASERASEQSKAKGGTAELRPGTHDGRAGLDAIPAHALRPPGGHHAARGAAQVILFYSILFYYITF